MDVADRPGKMIPGLATEWKVDDADKTVWIFKLRPGVKFHDGSAFTADAVVWNLDKVLDTKSPQFDQRQSAQVRGRLPGIASYKKRDDMTVEIKTKTIDALFPLSNAVVLGLEPRAVGKSRQGLEQVRVRALRTGPFKMARLVPRERVELVKNDAYWDPKRIPKTDRLILVCAPEDSSRTAALISNSVEMIETPPPDTVEKLKQSGMKVVTNVTAARLELSSVGGRGLAVDRHPAAQGGQPRDRSRLHRQVDEWPCDPGLRPG